MKREIRAIAALLILALGGASGAGATAERHAGYYYPKPQAVEEYEARSKTLPDASRRRRLAFVNDMMVQILSQPYPPQFAVFAKGDGAEKLIIVGLYGNAFNTLFRARALLAMLTALSRRTKFFRENKVDDIYTFFDYLFLLGFKQLTISDGDSFAHQIRFKAKGQG